MRAYVMASLIEDCGVTVARQLSECPGQILYRDNWQIVAKPEMTRGYVRAVRRRSQAAHFGPAGLAKARTDERRI